MTNPDNTVGTNAGYNGRTTPNAFNDILAAYSGRGIVAGWACSPKSGMTVQLGGDGTTRDVAIAEDNTGNRTTINNRTATPVEITLGGAPSTGSRIDTIVAYVNNPQSGDGATDVDFPSQVGIIAVSGTASGSPSAPSEATIRSAITSDGADGASAYYVELARITVGQGVTTIGSGVISSGAIASPSNISLGSGSVGTTALASNAVTTGKIANSAVTEAKIDLSSFTLSKGTATLNTTYLSGTVYWEKIGRMVKVNFVNLATITNPPNSTGVTAISNLPKSATGIQRQLYLLQSFGNMSKVLRLGMDAASTTMFFHWSVNTGTATEMDGEFIYFTD